jgi:hypothetical protein
MVNDVAHALFLLRAALTKGFHNGLANRGIRPHTAYASRMPVVKTHANASLLRRRVRRPRGIFS